MLVGSNDIKAISVKNFGAKRTPDSAKTSKIGSSDQQNLESLHQSLIQVPAEKSMR